MQIFDSVSLDQIPMLRDYVYRAGWFLALFLFGLVGRIALAWISKVNDSVERSLRTEIRCEERNGRCKRGRK